MACTNPVRLQKDFSISSLKATEPRGVPGFLILMLNDVKFSAFARISPDKYL